MIFSYGLFTIAAQSLLFREFLPSFEGNDISVGIFFGSWFLWVGAGAILVYRVTRFAEKLLKHIELVFLAYLPAFVLQLVLIVQARELAGIEAHALLSIRDILLLSIIVNSPVSLVTGMLFPLACRWASGDGGSAVSRVYIFEAAGSFAGGLGATILLGLGVNFARIFFAVAIILSLSVFVARLAGFRPPAQNSKPKTQNFSLGFVTCALSLFVSILFGLGLVSGADKNVMRYLRMVRWTKLLPKSASVGSFQTAQAEYIYGMYGGQWVVIREGSACETLPDVSAAGRIIALTLCQDPDANSILIVGSGLGLCYEFLHLPQIKDLTWAHPDSEYARKVEGFIPPQFKASDERFRRLNGDIRSALPEQKQFYDIVIVNLPEATSSVLNRYYTLEFYSQIKQSLRPGGILAVRISGGENIMGTELINLGASTKLTLQKVFSRFVIVPGEDTWFIASDSDKPTGDPATLRDRFAAIKGAAEVFSPQALLSVYLPDRAAKAVEAYAGADLPESMLVNRDARPLTHLYSLLLAAKQSGAPVTRFVKYLALAGPPAFLVPILVLIILRAVYVLRTKAGGSKSSFDSSFLVFSAGALGIGVVIVLMYLYQTAFGSLYLHIGVISSLFMVGLTIGAGLVGHLPAAPPSEETGKTPFAEILLLAVVLLHSLILSGIAFWPAAEQGLASAGLREPAHLTFAIAFILCGLCGGGYFPIAARQLAEAGFDAGRAGSKLETADHIGASLGAVLTGLLLVPVLGTRVTLLIFIALILANLPLAGLKIFAPEKVRVSDTTASRLRRLGYILFGVGLSIVVCSNLLADTEARLRPSLPPQAAQALAGALKIEQASAIIPDGARKVSYFIVRDESANVSGYIFSSEDLAPDVRGFGGKMNLAIYVDAAGKLLGFHIIRSNETPSYLELLGKWRQTLSDRQLFGPQPFAGVDAVTGATLSSKAILSAIESSGRRFAAQILGRSIQPQAKERPSWAAYLPDRRGIYLIAAFAVSLLVTYKGGFRSRLAALILNLVVGGIILNAQYSTEQMVTLLSAHIPAVELTGVFLLVVGVPALVIIFGNMYCGYICPFGAAQELLGYIIPKRFRQPIPTEKMQKARFVKYCVLLVFITVFFLSRNRATLAADPLILIFNLRFSVLNFRLESLNWPASMWLIVIIAVAGAILYPRFWCRYVCPAGAFLSLFNNIVILKKLLPAKWFGRCEFGLTAKDQMDCIYCDRCRYAGKIVAKEEALPSITPVPANFLWRFLVLSVLIAAIFVSATSIDKLLEVAPVGIDYSVTASASAGQPRDVDLQRVRTMIEQKQLSDREAEFYKKVE